MEEECQHSPTKARKEQRRKLSVSGQHSAQGITEDNPNPNPTRAILVIWPMHEEIVMLADDLASLSTAQPICGINQGPEYGETHSIFLDYPGRTSPTNPWVYTPGTPRYRRLRRVPRVLADSGWEDNSAT